MEESPESIQVEARKFLPPAFAEKKDITVRNVTMKCRRTTNGRCRVSYTVDWNEPQGNEPMKNDADASSGELNSARSSTSVTSSATTELFKKSLPSSIFNARSLPTKPSSSCICPHPKEDRTVARKCNGPCGRQVAVQSLTLMGQCEHAICPECLLNSPRVSSCFGVFGCPNAKCYLFDIAALCPDKAKRLAEYRKAQAIKSMSSCFDCPSRQPSACESPMMRTFPSSSKTSFEQYQPRSRTPQARQLAKDVLHRVSVTFAIFRDGSHDDGQYLEKQFYELPSNISVGAALRSCISENPEFARYDLKNRCFIGPSSFMEALDRQTWNPVSLDSPEPLYKLEDDLMHLMLIIDLVAVRRR